MFEEIIIPWTEKNIFISIWNKKFPLKIYDTTENEEIYIKCEWANINQPYPKEDLNLLITDLPDLIKDYQLEKKTSTFQMRLSVVEKLKLEENSHKAWYKTVSEFIKSKCVF